MAQQSETIISTRSEWQGVFFPFDVHSSVLVDRSQRSNSRSVAYVLFHRFSGFLPWRHKFLRKTGMQRHAYRRFV